MSVHNRGDEYLMEHIDKAVSELVYPKYKLQKAYNYYNGYRDAEQYRYLEENFGIGNPTSIEFTPLIRKHVDALLNEYLGTPLLPKVSCKDKETISKITRDKELKITEEVYGYLQRHLNNQILRFLNGQDITDKAVEQQINKLVEEINNNFISDYEIAAQNVVEYIIQSRDINLLTKLKNLLLDLLVAGMSFYQVRPTKERNNVEIEALDPRNVFVDRNPDSVYVKDSYRVVIRRWLTKQQILNKYGSKLDDSSINELEEMFEGYYDSSYIYVRAMNNATTGAPITDGLEAGKEVIPGFPTDYYETYNYKLIPVFEVEWIDVDKEGDDFIENRYEGVKIGQSIYILTGKSPDVIRTKDNPSKCGLSVNGLFFVNRSNEPYSLVLACSHLQDKYDLITFFKDNIIANSGTAGDWVDFSMLPIALGDDLTERLQKFIAYKKTGIAPIDTSQEGRAFNNNTSFAGFDDSLKADTIQAFELALDRIENTCSSITGVFRERLDGIETRAAVNNVKVGMRNSYIITKGYYQQMDTLSEDILIDSLNIAKKVWKHKPLTGILILGDKLQKVFTALPEHFTFTDYDVHVTSSSKIMEEIDKIQQIMMEFIKAGQLDPDIAMECMTARSMTELKSKLSVAFQKRRDEVQNTQQLQQQLEELQKQLDRASQEKEKLINKIESLNEAKLALDKQKIEYDYEIGIIKAQADRDYKQSTSENDTKRTDIEVAQQYDGNQRNNEIKNI